jgi:hypothetical protein
VSAIQHKNKKVMLNLSSPIADAGVAAVFTQSAKGKYAPHDWRKGMPWQSRIASLKRHLAQYEAGIDYDTHLPTCTPACTDHSMLPHIDHIAANCIILQEFFRTKGEFDDRYKLTIPQQLALQAELSGEVLPNSKRAIYVSEEQGHKATAAVQFDAGAVHSTNNSECLSFVPWNIKTGE